MALKQCRTVCPHDRPDQCSIIATLEDGRLRQAVLPQYPPERVAAITGAAADVERLAHLYGRARAPFLRLGQGMSRHAGGGMTIRTIACLPALVGAWDKPGGGALLFTSGAFGFDYKALCRPDLLARPTRVINHSTLGRALLECSDPPIAALFVAANNPAVTCPDQQRMVAGLSREDLFTVVHDTFLTDTARYADIVLPASTAFESEDLYRSYGSYYVQYGPQVVAPQGDSHSTPWLVQQLADRLGLDDAVFGWSLRQHVTQLLAGAHGPAADLTADTLLAGGPVRLRYEASGPALTYFYSAVMAADGHPPLPEWRPAEEGGDAARWPLRLLAAPGHAQSHTAFDGVAALHRQEPPRCLIHPADAAVRGIGDGDAVALCNERGHVGLLARVTPDTQPGLVVVEGHRNRARYLSGGPLDLLTSDRLSDLGAGATYQDTRVGAYRL